MTVRAVEGKKPYTGGKGIEIDENKVISLRLRDENNLIIWDEGDNEIYVDLQLDDEIRPTDAFPVGITTGRVIIDNGWDKTGTLICAKTTSGDNIKIFYSDDGHLYVDHGTGLFTQVYLKPEVDALLSDLRTYVDTELAKKQDKLIAGDNIEIAQDGKTISAILPPLNRFLSLWDCSTGMPISFPTSTLPFEYESGDHFLVETVDSTTNYKPSGTEYDGTASQTVETADVQPGDVYIYDGTTWLLQINHDKTVSFAQIAGQPSDNQALAQALNSKQNTLTAGQNINIDQNNEISATDTTYNAGTGIEIKNGPDYSAMQGPAPDGFHVPLNTDRQAVYNVWTALGGGSRDGINFGIALKLPFAGLRSRSSADVGSQGISGNYWSSSPKPSSATNSYRFYFNSSNVDSQSNDRRAYGFSVRCFKNSPTMPTSSWTKLYGTSIEAGGIFWSSTDGLISMSSDGQTWITIADKNLGATQVWNSGDTLSEANCGKYYQWGNNYGFPFIGTIANQSTTQVDASNYGPGNYYSSDTFIKYNGSWDSTDNGNLWGGETGVVTFNNAITNTGVLSVNGQTGDVTIQTGGTYTAGNGINIDANDVISVDSAYMSGYIPRSSGIHPDNLANSVLYYGEYLNGGVTTSLGLASDQVGVRTDIDQQNRNRAYLEYYNGAVDLYLSDTVSGANTTAMYKSTGIESTAGGTTEIFEFQGTGNDKIARLKDIPSYTASTGISINANNEISNTLPGAIKSSTAPSNPSQGDQWYDTTNDELKIYDGSAWNAVGGGGDVGVSSQANNVFTPGMKIWGGTSANYANLTPDGNTAYLII